jgi:hypothetical protein
MPYVSLNETKTWTKQLLVWILMSLLYLKYASTKYFAQVKQRHFPQLPYIYKLLKHSYKHFVFYCWKHDCTKSFKIPTGYSESVNRRRTTHWPKKKICAFLHFSDIFHLSVLSLFMTYHQGLPTLPEHMSRPPVFSGSSSGSIFSFLYSVLWEKCKNAQIKEWFKIQ